MTSSTLPMKQGDLLPAVRAVLHDTDPATGNSRVMDLTGCTVRFHLRLNGSGTPVVNAAASVIDATNGIVEYAWVAGDTATPGDYLREWEVTVTASSKQVTVPNSIEGYPVRIAPGLA